MSAETATRKVKYIVNERGKRTHAIMPMKDYEELLEDLHDLVVIAARKDEDSISLDELKKRLYGSTEIPS